MHRKAKLHGATIANLSAARQTGAFLKKQRVIFCNSVLICLFQISVQQHRLHYAPSLLDLFILVRQSIKLLCIRNYDPHSREQSSFSVLFNVHHQWGKDTNISATKPSSVCKAITLNKQSTICTPPIDFK